jgi:hypothetical protein
MSIYSVSNVEQAAKQIDMRLDSWIKGLTLTREFLHYMHLMYMDLPCPEVGEIDPTTGLSIRPQDVTLTGLVLYGYSEEHTSELQSP